MVGNKAQIIDFLRNYNDEAVFEIKESRSKRTMTQNGYCWELISRIADKLRISKQEVYVNMLYEYGQSVMVAVSAIVDVDLFFKYYKYVGSSEIDGVPLNNYLIYKGISEYDVKEMGIFIDGLCRECYSLKIPTITRTEIAKMALV